MKLTKYRSWDSIEDEPGVYERGSVVYLASDVDALMTWQPIETAPKDRLIDIWTGDRRRAACYWDDICHEWRSTANSGHMTFCKYPTHWMEIPEPPK